MNERQPKPRGRKRADAIAARSSRMGRMTGAELAEHARKVEGTVDEAGMRTVYLAKTDEAYDEPRLAQYEADGYKVEPAGYRYKLTIPNSIFQQREQERFARSAARARDRAGNIPGLQEDSYEVLEAVKSPAEFMKVASDLGAGGASEFDSD